MVSCQLRGTYEKRGIEEFSKAKVVLLKWLWKNEKTKACLFQYGLQAK